jgi:hypothetical protein
MTDAARIARLIQQELPTLKSGTLRFWGQWFGRPMDNIHEVTGAIADGELLEIQFDGGETLCVLRPAKWVIGVKTFRIDDAAKVRWEWNAYGRPPGRRYFQEYVRTASGIEASTDVDWYVANLQPSASEPAVEIV